MAIANPRIHIICGICGDNKMFKFYIKEVEEEDETDNLVMKQRVTIVCNNCSSITGLDELMEEEDA